MAQPPRNIPLWIRRQGTRALPYLSRGGCMAIVTLKATDKIENEKHKYFAYTTAIGYASYIFGVLMVIAHTCLKDRVKDDYIILLVPCIVVACIWHLFLPNATPPPAANGNANAAAEPLLECTRL